MNVLDDDIVGTTSKAQALAFENSLVTHTNNALVAAHVQWFLGSVVVGARDPGAVVALVLNPGLTSGGATRALRGGI